MKKKLGKIKKNLLNQVIIMVDFNTQIRDKKIGEEIIMGPYSYGKRNERGKKLVEFWAANHLKIVDTYYKRGKGWRWTWISPNQEFKTQINYVITTATSKKIKKFDIKKFPLFSDQRLIFCKMDVSGWLYSLDKVE